MLIEVNFRSLDDMKAISLESGTEQDLLVVEVSKELILNDQLGVSLVLDPEQFDEEDDTSFFISSSLQP